MKDKHVNPQLIKDVLVRYKAFKPELYILTYANITNTKVTNHCVFGDIPLLDNVLKKYRYNEYKYDESTESLLFSNCDSVAVAIPQICTEGLFDAVPRTYYGCLISRAYKCNITNAEVHKSHPFLTTVDWKYNVPLSRFSHFYKFSYDKLDYVIIGHEELADVGKPIWIDD